MKNKKHIIKFRKINYDIFKAIKNGDKKVETRANTISFQNIKAGDELAFSCAGESLKKKVRNVKVFKNIKDLLKEYKPSEINPRIESEEELIKMYNSFPEYREKIKKHGIIAFEI